MEFRKITCKEILIEPDDKSGNVFLLFEQWPFQYLIYYRVHCIYNKLCKVYTAIWEIEHNKIEKETPGLKDFYVTLKLLGLIGEISDD